MFELVYKRNGKPVKDYSAFTTIEQARETMREYNAKREHAQRLNRARQIAFNHYWNELRNAGEMSRLKALNKPKYERIPAEVYIIGKVEVTA